MMKKETLLWIAAAVIGFMGSCAGDHSDRHGKDTAKIKYDSVQTLDTAKVTTTTGGATDIDNSASGGTKAIKDTMKRDSTKK